MTSATVRPIDLQRAIRPPKVATISPVRWPAPLIYDRCVLRVGRNRAQVFWPPAVARACGNTKAHDQGPGLRQGQPTIDCGYAEEALSRAGVKL